MYDRSQEKIRELEREAAKLKDELTEAELRHQKMYLQMFLKGQQAAKLQADDDQVSSWEIFEKGAGFWAFVQKIIPNSFCFALGRKILFRYYSIDFRYLCKKHFSWYIFVYIFTPHYTTQFFCYLFF